MKIDDVDVVEINEAFAAQIVPCKDELEIPDEKLNPLVARSRSGTRLG